MKSYEATPSTDLTVAQPAVAPVQPVSSLTSCDVERDLEDWVMKRYFFKSDYTDLQTEEIEKNIEVKIKNTVIEWTVAVSDIEGTQGGYRLYAAACERDGGYHFGIVVELKYDFEQERQRLLGLKKNDKVKIRGEITRIRSFKDKLVEIENAVIIPDVELH